MNYDQNSDMGQPEEPDNNPTDSPAPESKAENSKPLQSQASIMVELVTELATRLFRTEDNEAYVVLPLHGHQEVHKITSKPFKHFMSGLLYSRTGRVPPNSALAEATQTLQALALFGNGSSVQQVHLRVARHDDKVYVDLANDKWEVVEIDAHGWRVLPRSPVLFIRSKAMRPMPAPAEGGTLQDIRELVNCGNDDDFLLLCGWIIGAFNPGGPFPVLCLHGEMGSGKSSTSEFLRRLVDPSQQPHRALPREERDLWIAAKWAHLQSFDNVSTIPDWLSDALCRLATGGAYGVRAHYEDDEEQLFQATRPILLNGIPDAAIKSDLVDRCIVFHLPTISAHRRLTKVEWSERCERSIPGIMGAIFDAVSRSLQNWNNVKLPELSRMADFEKWATAARLNGATETGRFSEVYERNRSDVNATILEGSDLGSAIITLVDLGNSFHGTATSLLEMLRLSQHLHQQRVPGWMKNPQTLSGELRRIVPNLARAGILVRWDGQRDTSNCKLISIHKQAR